MNFCKGMFLGLIVGAGVAAVAVASNTKLSGSIKDKTECAKKKLSKVLGKIKDKLDKGCGCCGCAQKADETANQNVNQNPAQA